MNWDMKTATGREKLLIRDRKLSALYQIEPDLTAGKPYSFSKYMAPECILRSDKLPEPLTGRAVMDFLVREKQAAMGWGPSPEADMVECEDDGEILMRIRPRRGGDAEDGELVQLELNADGQVCEIRRFDEKKRKYRVFSTSVTLTPVRTIREGEKTRYEKNKAESISFSSLYYEEMELIFTILPECPYFEELEERYMNLSDWAKILDLWKEINETGEFQQLCDRAFDAEPDYVRKSALYREELENLVRTVLEKRGTYSRRMQAWMEEWLNSVRDEYDLIRKY